MQIHRSALVLLASLAATPLVAQEVRTFPAGSIRLRSEAPAEVQYHRYDPATGQLERLPAPLAGGSAARAGVDCFPNKSTPGSSSHPVTRQELVDWGMKQCGASTFVRAFEFAYRTDTQRSNLSVSFYAGTLGWGTLGTEVRRYTLKNFPGGFNTVHFITVDTSADPFVLPDGPIGWGFTNDDGGFGAGTLLAFAPSATLGTYDALDVYDNPPAPTGIYTGTFNFGPGTNVGSVYMSIVEEDASVFATAKLNLGSGLNPAIFLPTSESMIGAIWTSTFDLSGFPAARATAVALSAGAVSPTPFPFGELLIDPLLLSGIDVAHGSHAIAIPNDLSMVGLVLHTQGMVSGGSLRATNGIDLTLGF